MGMPFKRVHFSPCRCNQAKNIENSRLNHTTAIDKYINGDVLCLQLCGARFYGSRVAIVDLDDPRSSFFELRN